MTLRPRIALGVLGLSLACQMGNPAFDPDQGGDETRGNADSLDSSNSADGSAEGNSNSNTGDGDASTGDGDSSTGDGDASTGDGDASTGDGDASTGDGDASTGDGDASTGDGDGTTATGDGDGDGGFCGNGIADPGEECDDGNPFEGDNCNNDCTLPDPDTTGDGDGDGDGGMVSCPIVMNPFTCSDCVNLECCEPAPLACLDDPVCMCVVHCLLQGQWGEMACYQQICMADINKAMLVDAAFPCIQTHCPQLCAN